jgi:hypothetical protein
MEMVTLKIDDTESITCASYKDAYRSTICAIAFEYVRNQYEDKKNYINSLMNAAIKCYIEKEREDMIMVVESDYDFFIEKDDGILFDLISYYYNRDPAAPVTDQELAKKIGERLIRNYEIYCLEKIEIDIADQMEVIRDELARRAA